MELAFKGVTYTVNGKDLLEDVSGFAKAGELTALMGASGAGKTTLLDVLAGRKNTGVILGEVSITVIIRLSRTLTLPRIGGFDQWAGDRTERFR